ncbi:MAG: YopX family protein [Lachnospira pectinoschiza]|jgi:uncharacterized phage protein (TIGR01671 family)|nr:MAG TPA: YopX protein [Bacteriophage sp.]
MDRYLFKAKRVDNGEWVQGNLIQSCDATDGWEAIIIPTKNSNMFTKHIKRGYGNLGFENWYRVDPSTICQCTGLKDKNGKLIWENDIVNTQCGKAIVVWDKAELRIKWIKDTIWRKDLHFWTNEDDWKCEVIGNIFDNPELLESEE